MADMSSSEKDPYMQAYITARMKNQVEEMKLQKILSSMEVSQRVRKIMINLELFEDRKVAHKLQKEVMGVANRQRQAMQQMMRHKRQRQLTAAWTTSIDTPNPDPNDPCPQLPSGQPPHPSSQTPGPPKSGSRRAVFPVTRGRDYGPGEGEGKGGSGGGEREGGGGGEREGGGGGNTLPVLGPRLLATSAGPRTGRQSAAAQPVPIIQVSDCSDDNNNNNTTAAATASVGWAGRGRGLGDSGTSVTTIAPSLSPPRRRSPSPGKAPRAATCPTKTTTIITPPPLTCRLVEQQQQQQQPPPRGSSGHEGGGPSPAAVYHSAPASLRFPAMGGAFSVATACAAERRRLKSAACQLWPGDPRAIGSVRRARRAVDEMLSTVRSGEETRRLIRQANPPCSRNCGQPNIVSQMERTYSNLPDLLPEIDKVRQRMMQTEEEAALDAAEAAGLQKPVSAHKRKSVGRFDLQEDEDSGAQAGKLPIYHIDYSSLREIGGTRRNSVLA